jgi:IclR family acetate operon transcriptional repressor
MTLQGRRVLLKESSSHRPTASVVSTFRVLEEVAKRQPVGVSEIARNTGIAKSTVQRCLQTLSYLGWLRVSDPERAKWVVTTKPLGVGLRAAGEEGLREAAAPHLDELRDRTDETVHLSAREGEHLIVLARRDSTQAVRTFVEIGSKAPLLHAASGLAFLAQMPLEEVKRLLQGRLDRQTPDTVMTQQELQREIESTRDRGYAVKARSWRPGVSAVAAAVTSSSLRPVAAISISIPSSRFEQDQVEFFGACVTEAAKKIGETLEGF